MGTGSNDRKNKQRLEKDATRVDDSSFTDPIPSNQADFVTLVVARGDYKNRKARDEASKIG